MSQVRATIFVFVYCGYVLIGTLYPLEFSADLVESLRERFGNFFASSSRKDLIINIPLFIPLGVLLYCRFSVIKGKVRSLALATLTGAGFSLTIEILQFFFFRHPSAFDVLSNTLGAGAGAVVAAVWPRRLGNLGCRFWRRLDRSGTVLGMAALVGATPLILSILQSVAPFSFWNPRFGFQIGNEATFARPWLGKIHFVALYNRALSVDEIVGNFSQGPATRTRLPEALLSLYTFTEGEGDIVYDRSGVEPPMDLRIAPQGRVRWLRSDNGIEILRPAIVRSTRPAAKLFDRVRETNEVSIEVWMTPHDTMQGGPARIVSFSAGTQSRNFTIGQQGSEIVFRLRTPATGRNGAPLALKTTNGIQAIQRSHIVATYKNGVESFYINGEPQTEVLDLTRDGIIGLGTRKTQIGWAAYSFLYFFPVSFLVAAFLSARSNGLMSRLLPFAIGAGLCAVTEVFQVLVFARVANSSVILWSVFMAILGTFSGRVFALPERWETAFFRRGSFAG